MSLNKSDLVLNILRKLLSSFIINKLDNNKAEAVSHNIKVKAFFSEVGNDLRTPKFKKFDKEIGEMKSIIENIHERS